MRRILLAFGVGAALFAVVAFAASLVVNSGGLQTGSDEVECDDGVNVFYQDTEPNGNYDKALVTDVQCPGTKDITVDVQTSTNVSLAKGTLTTSATGTVTVPFTAGVLGPAEVAAAHHVRVTIVTVGP